MGRSWGPKACEGTTVLTSYAWDAAFNTRRGAWVHGAPFPAAMGLRHRGERSSLGSPVRGVARVLRTSGDPSLLRSRSTRVATSVPPWSR